LLELIEMKFKYFFIFLFIILSCTPGETNNTEEVIEEVVEENISDEVWHWCVGNHYYAARHYDKILTSNYYNPSPSQQEEIIDLAEIAKLNDTLYSAYTIWFVDNGYSEDPYKDVRNENFNEWLRLKYETPLEICAIWFNINNP